MPLSSPPLVTVIVLLYNNMPYGLRAVESVLAQTSDAFQLVIIDNGSTDSTWQCLQQYRADPRVILHRMHKNQKSDAAGPYAMGVTTPYLSFLFADDTYVSERLALGIKLLEADSAMDYVFFRNAFSDEKGTPLTTVSHAFFSGDISAMNRLQHLRHFFGSGSSLHPCGMFIRTAAYQRLGGFKNYMHRIGDMAFFTRLLANADGLFLPDIMQNITVWSTGRNEAATNVTTSDHLMYERTFFLGEYLKPEIFHRLPEIFGGRQAAALTLDTDAERLWFLAHQALRYSVPDLRLFGFRLLYQAAELADSRFECEIIKATGQTISEYILTLATTQVLPPTSKPPLHGDSLRVRVMRALALWFPFTVPIYRALKARVTPSVGSRIRT